MALGCQPAPLTYPGFPTFYLQPGSQKTALETEARSCHSPPSYQKPKSSLAVSDPSPLCPHSSGVPSLTPSSCLDACWPWNRPGMCLPYSLHSCSVLYLECSYPRGPCPLCRSLLKTHFMNEDAPGCLVWNGDPLASPLPPSSLTVLYFSAYHPSSPDLYIQLPI